MTRARSFAPLHKGKGLVATLLNNQELANDLHALITN